MDLKLGINYFRIIFSFLRVFVVFLMEYIDKTSQTLENTKILFTLDFYHSTHQVDKRTRNHLTLPKPSFNLLLCGFSGFHISYLALLPSNPSHTPLFYGLPKSVHPTSPHPNLHILHFFMVCPKSLYYTSASPISPLTSTINMG